MEPLAGKVALVTGAARGQGKAHALTLAAAGADIVAFDVPDFVESGSYPLATAEDLAATVQAVRETGRDIVAIEGDVRSSKSLCAAAAAGIDHFGRIDICIANAGIWNSAAVWQLSDQQWQDMVDINLTGVWRTTKAVIPHMIEAGNGASIVLTSSMNGVEAGGKCAHYTAAKHGVIGLMRSLALELAPYGIRCNAVCPGSIDTPMVNWPGAYDMFAGHAGGTRQDFVAAGRSYHALAGVGPIPPEAIANAALWLSSDAAAYVTGTLLPVDAGHLILPRQNANPVLPLSGAGPDGG